MAGHAENNKGPSQSGADLGHGSDEQFKILADYIPNLAWMAHPNGDVFWFNKRWHDYTGIAVDEIVATRWSVVLTPESLPAFWEAGQRALLTAANFEMTLPLKSREKTFSPFLIRVVPVFDRGGKVERWIGSATDVTRQLETESALKASEEKFRTMAESSDVMIALSDSSSNATYFNKAWMDLTGRPVEALLKFGWADLIHEEDRQRFLDIYLDAFAKRTPFIGEFRMLNRHGEYRWLLAKGPPVIASDGSFHGYISSSIDITDQLTALRKVTASEETLRSLVVQAPIGICVMDGPTQVSQIVNASFLEVAGKPYEAIVGKWYWEPFAEVREYYEQALTDVVEKGITYYASEVEMTLVRHGRPEQIFVTFVYEPLKSAAGKVEKVVVWVLENTPQVQARMRVEDMIAERTRELAAANQDLEKSNRELAQFAYIASHDLQEPIRKIGTFTDMLGRHLRDNASDQVINYLDKINSSTTRMQTLIRDVLTYSEVANVNEMFERVDLNKVINAIKNDYDLLISEKGAIVESAALPTIDAVPAQVTQLFANLLSNSLKFAKRDMPPRITITLHPVTEDEVKMNALLVDGIKYHRIVFADNGIGFDAEHADRIFNIFQRLHRKSEFEGTGIGLAMCKKIVLNHRGDMNAIGSSPNGAVFNIFLPDVIRPV